MQDYDKMGLSPLTGTDLACQGATLPMVSALY